MSSRATTSRGGTARTAIGSTSPTVFHHLAMTRVQTTHSGVSVDVKASERPRAVIYARVSVDDVRKGKMTSDELAEAASLSVRAQLAEGRKLAKAKRLNVVSRAGRRRCVRIQGQGQASAGGLRRTRRHDRPGRCDAASSPGDATARQSIVRAGISKGDDGRRVERQLQR
jgi:hypothetical protein